MVDVHYWIQLENKPWDVSPCLRTDVDRMTGRPIADLVSLAPVAVTLPASPFTGSVARPITMHNPIRRSATDIADALILRRYRPPTQADGSDAWTVPDDRKINPWDLNEPDPGENGTRGTIPGPTLECDVGDTVFVHFRNKDGRSGYGPLGRTHSLHPHGVVFAATSDGAYPLSPPDPTQPVGDEAALWTANQALEEGAPPAQPELHKRGDRIPPDCTFTYTWNTFSWPTTAGVWLYHDHSINDVENVALGAIGMIMIHNANDNQDVDVRLPTADDPTAPDPALMPGGSATSSPVEERPTDPLPSPIPIRAADLTRLRRSAPTAGSDPGLRSPAALAPDRAIDLGDGLRGELDRTLTQVERLSTEVYRTPPDKLMIMQLYHEVDGAFCINGRRFLGNTPTVVAGTNTLMRFGVVSMGSFFHTFHLHGHRWILPGPHGTTPTDQQFSPMDTPVSQFEDTRTIGPANSLVFTVDGRPGSFMRAGGPDPAAALGEWHMHCHVLAHMMAGMMGSLLIVEGGQKAGPLPVGHDMDPFRPSTLPRTNIVHLTSEFAFDPPDIEVDAGTTVSWIWDDTETHTVTSDTGVWPSSGGLSGPGPRFDHRFDAPGRFPYFCGFHGAPGAGMHGSVTVVTPLPPAPNAVATRAMPGMPGMPDPMEM